MIVVDDVRFSYPNSTFQLAIPELTLQPEETLAVVGPSGSGKTTLLNLIAGLLVPQSGRITVGEQEVTELGDAGRRSFRASQIGFVFQDFALLDYLSAFENILYPFRITPHLKLEGAVRQRAKDLAAACGIAEKLNRRPNALSQGEQQRVAICRSLIASPSLILADEATGNLDPANKSLILDLLFERTRETGAALLAVTHDHELLPRFDRVIDFSQFRIDNESAKT